MRIAMFTDSFYPYISGVSTAVVNLAQTLAHNGHEVFIKAPEPKKKSDLSFFHKNIRVHFSPAIDIKIYPDFRLGTGFPLSLNDMREFDPDIFHIHTPLTFGIEGALTAKALRKPVIQTFHTYYMDPDAMRLIGIRNLRLARLIQQGGWRFHRALSRLLDATVAPSEFVAQDLRNENTPNEIYVCPNILEAKAFVPRKSKSATATPRLIFVGRLANEKKVDLLLHTLAVLRKRDQTFSLSLIGDGPQREDLFNLSFKLGISDCITWIGNIPHDRLIREAWYQEGDIFCTLSRFETFGYTTIEAMAQGVPVLATRSRANKEIIGRGGVILPETKREELTVLHAAKVLSHFSEYDWNALGRAAQIEAARSHPTKVLPVCEQIYQEVIARKNV